MARHGVSIKTLKAAGPESVTANGTATVDVKDYIEGRLLINVTAVTGGTPTLDITFEDSDDNVTWYTHTTVTQITTVSNVANNITVFAKFVRIRWAIGGTTPIFTFKAVLSAKS